MRLDTVEFIRRLAAAIGFVNVGEGTGMAIAGYVLVSQITCQGARAGCKTHLADMDRDGRKSVCSALSNALIGVLLVLGRPIGALAGVAGPESVLVCPAPP